MKNLFQCFPLIFIPILLLLAGCDVFIKSTGENETKSNQHGEYINFQCITSQSSCFTETAFGTFDIKFNVEQINSEQPFQIQVIYAGDKNIQSISGYIEGVNMFMGKIPLFFSTPEVSEINKKSNNVWVGDAFIGSCSEEKMRWALWINAKFEKNTQEILIEFSSENID